VRKILLHLVTGGPRSGKGELIGRLTGERDAWLGMVNAAPGAAHPRLKVLPAGCPCCTGRVAAQIALAQAIRERRPQRVLYELGDEHHRAGLERSLAQEPLGRYLEIVRPLSLPQDAQLTAEDLEAG
jgi:hypothetical protein